MPPSSRTSMARCSTRNCPTKSIWTPYNCTKLNTAPASQPISIDLFCRVIDNLGDIGVCWRLARQLAAK
ncbi:elongation factor P maturation arginine rhamnosyltransferase EarP, partial [Alcaligenes pakistanensis]